MSTTRPTIQGWLTQPTTQGRASEGHTSAVNVLRMVGTRHQHHAAEPVPFRAQPAPLRSIKPPRAADGIACFTRPGVMCMHDSKCHDTQCKGHPCNNGGEYTPEPQSPSESRSLLRWLVAVVVFGLMAGAMALMGKPQDF